MKSVSSGVGTEIVLWDSELLVCVLCDGNKCIYRKSRWLGPRGREVISKSILCFRSTHLTSTPLTDKTLTPARIHAGRGQVTGSLSWTRGGAGRASQYILTVYVLSFACRAHTTCVRLYLYIWPAIPYRPIPADGQRRHTPRERGCIPHSCSKCPGSRMGIRIHCIYSRAAYQRI